MAASSPIRRTRRVILGILLVIAIGVGSRAVAYRFLRADPYHTPERKEAKARMIAAIVSDASAGPVAPATSAEEWVGEKVIHCRDGSWLIYQSRCHKQDRKVHDLFLAKASDGRWYYSTFHFCIGLIVIRTLDQPASLEDFVASYALKEFDGVSDQALSPTLPSR